MRNTLKRLLSILLTVVLLLGLIPEAALAANVSGKVVSTLASVYDGDEERAREILDALEAAGIIDAQGNMAELDIREDGQAADLEELASKIAEGGSVGILSINGKEASPQQILDIQQVKTVLEIVKLLDEDVEITEEHKDNLEALVTGILDGSIDLDEEIEKGMVSLDSLQSSELLAGLEEESDADAQSLRSSQKAGEGEDGRVTGDLALTDGKYTGSMLDGSSYDANYSFTPGREATTWFTDNLHNGLAMDGVVTMSLDKSAYSPGETVTVTASLNAAQPYPVSFDWKAGGEAVGVVGTNGGSIRWDAGETGDKNFQVTIGNKTDASGYESWEKNETLEIYRDIWQGDRALVISAANIKNALFSNGTGTSAAWNKIVPVNAADNAAIKASYMKVNQVSGFTTTTVYSGRQGYESKFIYKKLTGNDAYKIPQKGKFTLSFTTTVGLTGYLVDICFAAPSSTVSASERYEQSLGTHNTVGIGGSGEGVSLEFGSLADGIVNNNGETLLIIYISRSGNSVLSNTALAGPVNISAPLPSEHDLVKSVTVPQGTYYSGEVIPITVELDRFVYASTGTKLKVNNTDCPLLDAANTETRKLTFGYTVKTVDTGTLKVTGLTGLKNSNNRDVTLDAAFPEASFGTDQGVALVSDVKSGSIDWANVKYGICNLDQDLRNEQVVTVMLPLTGDLTWLVNEAVTYNTSGTPVSMPLPGYEDATADAYVPGAYFSMDGGAKRYPVYVAQSGGNAVALVTRFTAERNGEEALRRETLNLFMDPEILGTADSEKYLPAWEEKSEDAGGYAWFVGTGKESAPIVMGRSWTYYVNIPNLVPFDKDAVTPRGLEDYTDRVDEYGFLKLDDDHYVLLQDVTFPEEEPEPEVIAGDAEGTGNTENTGNAEEETEKIPYKWQHDVEVVVNADFRNAVINGIRAEEPGDPQLLCQFSDRQPFTETKPENFTWSVDDGDIAALSVDKDGIAHISFTGVKEGQVSFTVLVHNGAEENAYTLEAGSLKVLEGKNPFLNIPYYSQVRTTLAGTDTDVPFSSNVTARNAAAGSNTTVFGAKLYKARAVEVTPENELGYEKQGEKLWEKSFNSKVESSSEYSLNYQDTLTHITVPGGEIGEPGIYALEISTEYVGGEVGGVQTESMSFTKTAYLLVKAVPAEIHLNALESYYVTNDEIPAIRYTVSPADAEVEYTIQKSGEEVGERKSVSGGSIPLSAEKPAGLKDSYIITVYARNAGALESDPWSVDSLMLTVYNENHLSIIVRDVLAGEIGGTTEGKEADGKGVKLADGASIYLGNDEKLSDYDIRDAGDYQLTFDDFNVLRTDMSLQKIVSVNYGEDIYGMLSDKMLWSSDNAPLVSVDYKQGGIYSDIRNYSYVSYAPATDFLVVATDEVKDADKVTIKATHANTGVSREFTVTAGTLENRLYTFQFFPKTETSVTYVNGDGDRRTLTTNDKGQLAVYEPSGIPDGAVMALSSYNDADYAGTLYADDLMSGERDIASLQLYPCNNLRLRKVSSVKLTFLTPDGEPYNGSVTIRTGVYKNDQYCEGALLRTVGGTEVNHNGREDFQANVVDGKLALGYDASQFKLSPSDYGLTALDDVSYVIEYRFADSYCPGYVRLNVFSDMDGAARPTDSLIQLRKIVGFENTPQIVGQRIQQYYDGRAINYTRDVRDYTDNIGISKRFYKVELYTDVALSGETVAQDSSGFTTYESEDPVRFSLNTPVGTRLTGQTDQTMTVADQIVDLKDLEDSQLYVFPFSAIPFARGKYTMTDANMAADGLTDVGVNPSPDTTVKMLFTKGSATIRTETLPFGVSNLSHQKDLTKDGGGKELASEVKKELKNTADIGAIFRQIGVDEMLQKGFTFISNLRSKGSSQVFDLMILPTEDPGSFYMYAFIKGSVEEKDDDDDDDDVNYDPDGQYEDTDKFEDAVKDADNADDSDVDDDGEGEGSVKFSFHGAMRLIATCDVIHNKWGIEFLGGHVAAGVDFEYRWSKTFLCGPVPVLVEAKVGAGFDVEVGFASKEEVRAMLLDLTLKLSFTAFAGIGFDAGILSAKIGIEGNVTGTLNYLHLSQGSMNGTKLWLEGGIKLLAEVKFAVVSYGYTFASFKFTIAEKKWDQYDQIKAAWESQGFAQLAGETAVGRDYTMRLNADGTGTLAIQSGGVIEDRDYLANADRVWNGGAKGMGELLAGEDAANAVADVLTNAYPHADPALSDDGQVMVYISDNDNAKKLENAASYAVLSGGVYEDKGAIDTDEESVPLDSAVAVSGTGSQAFAAWVRELDLPEKEMKETATLDDVGMMLNSMEVYAGRYDGSAWTVKRLTENFVADMAPTVASSGDKAIVAWRSLSPSSIASGSEDVTAAFDAENYINYRYFDGGEWQEANVAYNGSAGSVNAVSSAMNADGAAILAYTVRTDKTDINSTETFYTVVGSDGEVVTTGRLTNNGEIDTSVQAIAVGEDFILGWYAENPENGDVAAGKTVDKSHDIRLARIKTNGSIDGNFPESLTDAATGITQSFRFSAPADNDDPGMVSVVWSQIAEEEEEDAPVYEMRAVRFYENGNTYGVSAPLTLAKTELGFNVDNFDTYTDESGKIYTLMLGTTYTTTEDLYSEGDEDYRPGQEYDSIKMPGQATLGIPAWTAVTDIKLASGSFEDEAIEAEAKTDLTELVPGLDLPVQFAVKNTGLETVTSVKVKVGGQEKTFGVGIRPGESAVLSMPYEVPENTVADAAYTVTATTAGNKTVAAAGTLVLNRPDVGIYSMKVIGEGDGKRDIQVILTNGTGIPLKGSGKTVKLAFYKDALLNNRIGSEITIPAEAFADIDEGIYTYLKTVSLSELAGEESEEGGSSGSLSVFAKAWVEGSEELNPYDNSGSVTFRKLADKYDSPTTKDSVLSDNGDGTYTVFAKIRNNQSGGNELGRLTADILDADGKVLKSVELGGGEDVTLGGEETRTFTTDSISLEEIGGTPASVSIRASEEPVPVFTTHRLVLTGEIGVDFKVVFPDEKMARNTWVDFVVDDGRKSTMKVSEAVKDQTTENAWMFTCYVNALEIGDTITAVLHYGDNQVLTNAYSVLDYCTAIRTAESGTFSQKLLDLVNALQDYGSYLQKSGWTDGKEHRPVPNIAVLDTKSINAAKKGVYKQSPVQKLSGTGIDSVKFSLTLNEATKINAFFKPRTGVTVTSPEAEEVEISGETYYRIRTDMIGARSLGNVYTITARTSRGTEASLQVSAMSYVKNVLDTKSMSTDKKYAMTAFYNYYAKALAYVGS